MVFFYDRADMWITILIMMASFGFLLYSNKDWCPFAVIGGVTVYQFYLANRYNPDNIAGAFIMAVSRIVIGAAVPFLVFIIFFRGTAREKDEGAGAYAIRSAIDAAAKAAMLAGLFFFMRSLINGEEILCARQEAYHSDSSFKRASSDRQSSGTSHKERTSFNEQASFRSSSNEKTPEQGSDYDILGVPETADFKDIQRAYREKVLKTHPDRVAKMGARYRKMAEEECKKVNAAFDRIRKARNYGFA
ncbi:MAG: J domain-containing protein [Candidatus Omnitrophica bacterium]|nr:J domain-containing protein [Candidatus Omnitrophota bacterium]